MPHTRHSIRLQNYDYAQPGAYFVTMCAHDRVCLFGEIIDGEMRLNEYGRVVVDCWDDLPNHFPYVELDAFVVMPNHVHGIVVIIESVGATHASPLPPALPLRPNGPPSRSLGAIIGSFKSAVTKRIHELPSASNFVVWQRNYYEHVVRDEVALNTTRAYIANNPRRWAEDDYHAARPEGQRHG